MLKLAVLTSPCLKVCPTLRPSVCLPGLVCCGSTLSTIAPASFYPAMSSCSWGILRHSHIGRNMSTPSACSGSALGCPSHWTCLHYLYSLAGIYCTVTFCVSGWDQIWTGNLSTNEALVWCSTVYCNINRSSYRLVVKTVETLQESTCWEKDHGNFNCLYFSD